MISSKATSWGSCMKCETPLMILMTFSSTYLHSLKPGNESEAHLALMEVLHMIRGRWPAESGRNKEATCFRTPRLTSATTWWTNGRKTSNSSQCSACSPFGFVSSGKRMRQSISNRRWWLFMSSSESTWCTEMGVFFVFFWCKSIKSDHPHYPIHLVGLSLGASNIKNTHMLANMT